MQMVINGFKCIGERDCYDASIGEGKTVGVYWVGPEFNEFWFSEVHSGSRAIEAAREILEGSSGIDELDVFQICSELILRITGERVAPSSGLQWHGNLLVGMTFEIDFSS